MKIKHLRFKNLILVVIFALMSGSAWAYEFTVGGIYYNIIDSDNHYVEVTYENSLTYNTYSGVIEIPETVTYNATVYTVTSIGDNAFNNCKNLTSVNLTLASLSSIGEYAFSGCTQLQNVLIHNQFESIGFSAFSSCTGVQTINVGGGTIGNYAFDGCSGATTLTIGSNVSSIGDNAFRNCSSLSTVYFNATNCTSASGLWGGCSALRTVNVSDNVTRLPGRVFSNTEITTVNFGDNPHLEVIGSNAFWSCEQLTSFTIPNTVTTIGGLAFMYDSGLTTLTIPENVTSIGESAFRLCTGLTTVNFNATNCTTVGAPNSPTFAGSGNNCTLTIGNSVTTIPSAAFYDFTGMTSLSLGSGVTSIENYAFYNCNNLATVNYNATNCTVIGYQYGNQCWSGCTHACTLVIGDNVNSLPAKAFTGFQGLNSIDFGSHESFSIPDEAFGGTGLTELVIPDFVTSIGKSAFAGCSSLITLTIGTGVTTFGDWAFYNCNHLATVNYNATNCTSAGVQSWPTFDNCGNGTNCTLTIGNNVTHLPQRIFYRFSGLTSFSIGTSLETISSYAFENCTGLTSITIPNNVTSIGSSAFAHCTSVTTLDLGTGVQTIGTNAFDGCEGLTSLTIPASVTGIEAASWGADNGAFKNCTGLAEIWFMGATVPSLTNNGVFGGVPNDIPVYVPKGYPTTGSWSYFTNYVSYLRFVGGTNNNNWIVANNWAGACTGEDTYVHSVPASNEIAIIDGSNDPMIPDIDEDEDPIQVYKIYLNNGRKIKILDGGQLLTDQALQVEVEKEINEWTTNPVGGWYFIASPINASLRPNDVVNLMTTDDEYGHTFDLYSYDATNGEGEGDPRPWMNYRAHSLDFRIENGCGYLYANKVYQQLYFTGETKPYSEEGGANKVALAHDGWNLIGNPFTCNVSVSHSFSELNNGSNVKAKNGGSIIAPCAGIAVYGNEGDQITFRLPLQQQSQDPSSNSLNMVLTKANMRDAKQLDNVIVSFDEDEAMPKFNFMEQDAKIYIPQDGKEYAIVHGGNQGVMPLNFVANENGEYAITVDVADVEMAYLHLIDNLTGADVDLLSTPSYQFTARKSDYVSRFKLVFSTNGVDEISDGDDSFAYYDGSEWVIANTGKATLQVVDMLGRVVSSETVSGNAVVSINQPAGVYVMRLLNGENVRVQKVVVR